MIQISSEKVIGTRFDINFPIMKSKFNERIEQKSVSA